MAPLLDAAIALEKPALVGGKSAAWNVDGWIELYILLHVVAPQADVGGPHQHVRSQLLLDRQIPLVGSGRDQLVSGSPRIYEQRRCEHRVRRRLAGSGSEQIGDAEIRIAERPLRRGERR